MTLPTKICLYFAGYSGMFIGAGLLVLGIGFAIQGACMALQESGR